MTEGEARLVEQLRRRVKVLEAEVAMLKDACKTAVRCNFEAELEIKRFQDQFDEQFVGAVKNNT